MLDAPASHATRGEFPRGLEEAARPRLRRRDALVQRAFEGRGAVITRVVLDSLLLLLAMGAAWLGADAADVSRDGAEAMLLFPPLVLALLALRGMYRGKLQLSALDSGARILGVTSLTAMALVTADVFLGSGPDAAPLVAREWLFASAYLAVGRLVLDATQRHARVERLVAKPTLIVGAGVVGAQVERRLVEAPELGLRPVGYLDADPPAAEAVPDRTAPVLGSPSDLPRVLADTGARHVILGFTSAPDSVLVPLVRQCEERGIEISLVPRLFESVNVHVALEHLGGLPLFGLRSVNPKGWQFAIKHALDRSAAALLLLFVAPLFAAIAVAIKSSSPGPVFFRQRRIGRDGREFEILKFRTMAGNPAVDGEMDADWALEAVSSERGAEIAAAAEDRRTRVGRFLRRYTLDELPQLVNVVRGEMSLVGPRPERVHYVRLFEESVQRYTDRHRVKSGLTGWAQVHGLRGNTSLSDRVEWDNYYIENWSLALDFKILLMTVGAIFAPPRDA